VQQRGEMPRAVISRDERRAAPEPPQGIAPQARVLPDKAWAADSGQAPPPAAVLEREHQDPRARVATPSVGFGKVALREWTAFEEAPASAAEVDRSAEVDDRSEEDAPAAGAGNTAVDVAQNGG
jgi:hypothetical protein